MTRRTLGLLFVVALAVRLGYVSTVSPTSFGMPDGVDYDRYARGILEGAGYPVTPGMVGSSNEDLIRQRWTEHPFIRPPLFPYYLSGVYAVFGIGNLTAVRVANAVIDSTTVVLLALIGTSFAGPIGGVTTGALAAVYPHLVVHTSYVGTETLFTFLVALLVWLLLRGASHPVGAVIGALYGLVVAGATLCRPIFLPMLVPLLAWVTIWGSATSRFRLRTAGAGVLVTAVLLGTWGYSNWRRSGEWYLFDGGGFMFHLGHNDTYTRIMSATSPRENDALEKVFYQEIRARFATTEGMSIDDRNRFYRHEAWRYIMDNPGTTLKLEVWKLWHIWRPWVNPNVYGRAALVVTGLAFGVTTVLGIAGLFLVWRDERCRPGVLLFLLFIATGTAADMATIAQVRYRVPVVDPYLMVAAGVTVERVASWWRRT
jgi:4-amino-4-deoxy-L-arabinose transferase-like glycosyltransferase